MARLEPFGFFILRTPLLELKHGLSLLQEEKLKEILSEEISDDEAVLQVRAALKTSAVEFFQQGLLKYGEKKRNTLIRYILRMSGRSTPFGLFAGHSLGRVSQATETRFKDSADWEVFVKRDGNEVLSDLKRQVTESIDPLYVNPTLSIRNEVMSIITREFDSDLTTRQVKKITLKSNKIGLSILKKFEKNPQSKEVLSKGRSSDTRNFLLNLIDQKVLVPPIPYDGFFGGSGWRRYPLSKFTSSGHASEANVILKKTVDECSLSSHTVNQVATGIILLHRLFAVQAFVYNKQQRELGLFCLSFENKFSAKELPLIDALDPNFGILDREHPFLRGAEPFDPDFSKVEKYFQEKILFPNERIVEWKLSKEDLGKLQRLDEEHKYRTTKLPSSVTAFVEEMPEGLVHLRSYFGMPSNMVFSRYGNADEELAAKLKEIRAWDDLKNTDVIFAEIIEWPISGRIANFTSRKIETEYVIPLDYPVSTIEREKQILLDDLLVSVNYGKIRLRSKKLNKEIIPLLSTSYNLVNEVNPFLRFLALVATQDNSIVSNWRWGKLRQLPYLPRVRYGNVVLSLRQWRLPPEEVSKVMKAPDRIKSFRNLAQEAGLPEQFYWYLHTDLKIFVDLKSDLILTSVLDLLHSKWVKTESYIEEVLSLEAVREYVIPFKNLEDQKQDPFVQLKHKNTRPDEGLLHIGDECVYFKVFLNSSGFDEFLGTELVMLLKKLEKKNLVKYWFFLKYNDPSPHLRIRLFLRKKEFWGEVIRDLKLFQKNLYAQNKIWNFQLETYKRDFDGHELDHWRSFDVYSSQDSKRALDLLENLSFKKWSEDQKLFYMVLLAHTLLDLCFPELEMKIEVTRRSKTAYRTMGFQGSRETENKYGEFWRNHKALVIDSIHRGKAKNLSEHFETYSKSLKPLFKKKQSVSLQRWIHLALNRTKTNITYAEEDQIYKFLYKAYMEIAHT